MRRSVRALSAGLLLAVLASVGTARAGLPEPAPGGRYVRARVAALEQPIVYNRFGSFNPYGTIYALLRDLEDEQGRPATADTRPGHARLRDEKRPRPLVLRANVGDILIVELTNLLAPAQPDLDRCRAAPPYKDRPQHKDGLQRPEGDERCSWRPTGPHTHFDELADEEAAEIGGEEENSPRATRDDEIRDDERFAEQDRTVNGDWPLTRTISFAVPGLEAVNCDGSATAPSDLATGIEAINVGQTQQYCFRLRREGTFVFSSLGAPAGGEGDGGSLSHGLFGAINVQPAGSRAYRSQVSQDVLAQARRSAEEDHERAGQGGLPPFLDYAAETADGTPLLSIHKESPEGPHDQEIVHGDLTAIIDRCPTLTSGGRDDGTCTFREAPAVREFTIIFHDELKTFYPDELKELESEALAYPGLDGVAEGDDEEEEKLGSGFNPLAGVRDGFAINYGASGMGSILLANRKGFGPAKDCVECAYEEFFLQSSVNGDPALVLAERQNADGKRERYSPFRDDPSNVYHSYLNDPVVYRNTHAGPKETHVFHLHAHQWLAQRADPAAPVPEGVRRETGTYLDSQTIAPMQGFSYEIHHGGSGNLNLTVGDSIFHCHLYPHFAQGMWALWRVHDVFEDGSRFLPDGELGPGTTDFDAGTAEGGTPIPAIVPLPGRALPPKATKAFPGYPFYIPSERGHRAPQPPNDMAEDAGLPRHIVTGGKRTVSGVPHAARPEPSDDGEATRRVDLELGRTLMRHALVTGDFTSHLEEAHIQLLPPDGTEPERKAMEFHAGTLAGVVDPDGQPMTGKALQSLPAPGVNPVLDQRLRDDPLAVARTRVAGYMSRTPDGRTEHGDGTPVMFKVNGSTDKPGAPYADPCRDVQDRQRGDPADNDPFINAPRRTRYDVFAVKTTIVANAKGWHDPQGHVNVLKADIEKIEGRPTGYAQAADVKPFFFRAHSGDCIEFRHTNRLPHQLALDDFQAKVPTDTLGQHIHLVKFDVTSSDGSGNGFNYEDGTFARGAIEERVRAAQNGGSVAGAGTVRLPGKDKEGKDEYQTTIQRWYAEPLLTWADDGRGKEVKADRTLRTVFTHDHFAPSNIQQHGFYSALIVEPRGSRWARGLKVEDGEELAPGRAVGTQALITLPGTVRDLADPRCRSGNPLPSCDQPNPDLVLHADPTLPADPKALRFREFAMAVADFALLYDRCRSNEPGWQGEPCADIGGPEHQDHGLAGVKRDLDAIPSAVAAAKGFPYLDQPFGEGGKTLRSLVEKQIADVAADHGRPVDPPKRPEAISKDHHNPYLFNYRNEPIPLRIGEPDPAGGKKWRVKRDPQGRITEQGELANVFNSGPHGDPATEIFEALEGERLMVRLVQGAQEVQHVASLHDLRWRREAGERTSPFVGAQEIGISEHFEIGVDRLPLIDPPPARNAEGPSRVDRLYSVSTVDALWNGAWGLIRVYDDPRQIYQAKVERLEENTAAPRGAFQQAVRALAATTSAGEPLTVAEALNRVATDVALAAELIAARSAAAPPPVARRFVTPSERSLRTRRSMGLLRQPNDRPATKTVREENKLLTCPKDGPGVRFYVEAWPVGEWLSDPARGQPYAEGAGGSLHDTAGLVYRLIETARGNPIPEDALLEDERFRLRAAARAADHARGYVPPLVLRANAGECIAVELTNCLLGSDDFGRTCRSNTGLSVVDDQLSDANPDGFPGQREKGLLPRIVPLNSQHLVPSSRIDLRPQLVTWDVTRAEAVTTGSNPEADPLKPGERDDPFIWYAGLVEAVACSPTEQFKNVRGESAPDCDDPAADKYDHDFRPVPFGAVPLASFADVIEHGSQGLVGTLVVEPESAYHLVAQPRESRDVLPARRARLDVPEREGAASPATLANGSQEALIVWREKESGIWAAPRRELVMTLQDGLGLSWHPETAGPGVPVPDCEVCDDSYDLGEKAASYRAHPFWRRLGLTPGDPSDDGRGWNLNKVVFPTDFLSREFSTQPPMLRAAPGEILSFRVTQPSGRARQRAFLLYGHDYPDLLSRFGSAGSALVGPGKAVNAHVCDLWMQPRRTDYGYETRFCAAGGAHVGRWLWRDGPAQHFASGVWGSFVIE